MASAALEIHPPRCPFGSRSSVTRAESARDHTWLWVKNRYPKWNPSKWKPGPKPVVPWWFHFDPYPHELRHAITRPQKEPWTCTKDCPDLPRGQTPRQAGTWKMNKPPGTLFFLYVQRGSGGRGGAGGRGGGGRGGGG